MEIIRSEEEINDVLNWVIEAATKGSHYPGMSYEEGVESMYDWLVGDSDERPDG